jgi:hypothetical protein
MGNALKTAWINWISLACMTAASSSPEIHRSQVDGPSQRGRGRANVLTIFLSPPETLLPAINVSTQASSATSVNFIRLASENGKPVVTGNTFC